MTISKYGHLNECPKCGKPRGGFQKSTAFGAHIAYCGESALMKERAQKRRKPRVTTIVDAPAPAPAPVAAEVARPTWEDIITAVPDEGTLAGLLMRGVFEKILEVSRARDSWQADATMYAKNAVHWEDKAQTAQRELRAALEANARLTEETAKLRDEINTKRVKLKSFDLDQFRQTVTTKARA